MKASEPLLHRRIVYFRRGSPELVLWPLTLSRIQEFFRRWTVSLDSLPVALRDRDISLVQFKILLKTLWFV